VAFGWPHAQSFFFLSLPVTALTPSALDFGPDHATFLEEVQRGCLVSRVMHEIIADWTMDY